MRAGVFFQDDVVLADRVRFLLGRQRYVGRRRSRSRLPSLLSSNRRLRRPPLTSTRLPTTSLLHRRTRSPRTTSLPTTGLRAAGLRAARSSTRWSGVGRLAARVDACRAAVHTGSLGRYLVLGGTDRSVLPRVLRRHFVVLRIRGLLQRNRSP